MPSFLQSEAWGQLKARYGWQPRRVGTVLVLARPIVGGRHLLYAPETEITEEDKIRELLAGVGPWAKECRAFVFRLEIAVPYSDEVAQRLKSLGFVKSFESVQPEWRALVDIRPNEEQVLSAMHPKGRYNIRVARRHGVTVSLSQDPDRFFPLYYATAKRDGFAPRPPRYLQDLLSTVPGATLVLAEKDGQPLAGAVVVFEKEVASYLYGAFSYQHRMLMAPYLLHWEIIREAKRRGATVYDLGEVPPETADRHPLAGLRDFKLKFGARIVHLVGSWDYIYSPLFYTLFRVGEKLRRGFRA